jgi:DNA-directed RNA polymerase subunit RPC12/RpoP
MEALETITRCSDCGKPVSHPPTSAEGGAYCLYCRSVRGIGAKECWFCGVTEALSPLECADPP